MNTRILFLAYVLLSHFAATACFASEGTADEKALPATKSYAGAGIPFNIAHPKEGQQLPYLKSSFVFGSADPRGKLYINGAETPIFESGGFLAMVPYSTGTFSIIAELKIFESSKTITRTIFVAPPAETPPASPLTLISSKPEMDLSLRTGETFIIECRGSPGANALAKIKGSKGVINLSETAPGSGIYRFLYRIKPGDNFKDSEISVTLENKKGRKSIVASGKISKLEPDSFWQAEVSADNAVVRSGYALTPADKAGYVLFPPQGTKFLVTGRRGQELEVRLNQARSGWIGETEVRPAGHSTPRITSGNLIVSYQKPNSLLRLYLGAKPPFEVTASPAEDKIDIRFFGVVSNTDWINYESTSSIISFVEWFQDDTETFRVTLHLKETNWWGYDARFENGSFVFEIRRPEKIPAADSTLKGIMVAIDAGHGPETGAVGPTGLEEKNVNLSIALSLEKMLLAQGAEVTMIRRGNEPVSLYDRIRKAQNIKADMLISIHNNALPEGQNPLVKNGFGAYYYYPQSFALAQEIHDSLAKAFSSSYSKYPLRDDGLYYGNLALARVPQMPAVLVECAYIIVPREESLLRNAGFQNACAQAITSGIKKFVAAKKKRK